MKSGDLVVLKDDLKDKPGKIGFYAYVTSSRFENGPLKISHIRHNDEFDMDFAVFSPFLEVPVQCLELS